MARRGIELMGLEIGSPLSLVPPIPHRHIVYTLNVSVKTAENGNGLKPALSDEQVRACTSEMLTAAYRYKPSAYFNHFDVFENSQNVKSNGVN